ncbi:alpha/beta fold hydrolase [Rhizobium ruizarguesonis]|uniref:alpha/beta fold hydrolase n=1 Tax=Rhizobium ruizarguesonis TaxID=2081791 RepID=UPI001030CB9B|nr:alpha/beta hydrolase [Rhizobium ruizarguesonis]TAT96111.1 alpha/beta hydrolase [Rhizobium ruizarguesonis]
MLAAINGTEIYFDIEGSGLKEVEGRLYEKPTIIGLHGGLGFDHGYLREGLGRLSEIAQIIYVDLRGHGRSGRPDLNTATLEQMADDVAELIKMLGIRKPHVFGHSAGGFVALHLALRHPKLVGGAILSGSSPTVAPIQSATDEPAPSLADRAPPTALEAAARVFGGDISTESVANYFEEVGPYYAAPENGDLTAQLMRLTSTNIEMMRFFMSKLAPGYDVTSRLHSIVLPVLVLVGAYDWVCPPRAGLAIANAVQNGRLVEFDKSGHFLFSEEPAKFVAVVEDFLANSAAPSWY